MADENKKKGVIGWAWHGSTYLFRRPAQDIAKSARGIGQSWAAYRAARVRREALDREERAAYAQRTAGMSPRERFASEAERGGWTADGLRAQEAAARLARRASVVICAIGFTGCLVAIVLAPPLLVLIFGIVAMALVAGCFASAVRSAWWEFQLQGRALIPLREFISRPDFFRRLFL